MKNNLCVAPWVGVRVKSDGDVIPCTVWNVMEDKSSSFGNIKNQSIDDIANSEGMCGVRKRMLNNEVLDECRSCNLRDMKNTGGSERSMRAIFNSKFTSDLKRIEHTTNPDGSLREPFKMKMLYSMLSNLCNMACRTCGPMNSSLWGEEEKKVFPVIELTKQSTQSINQIYAKLEDVEFINFAGGEPSLVPEHWEILDRLISIGRTNTEIHWITNLSKLTYKNKSILDYTSQLPRLMIRGSVDASHERAELYRHNTKWSVVEQNIRILNTSGVNFCVQSTVGATNLLCLTDLHKYLTREIGLHVERFYLHFLVQPPHLSAQILPAVLKKQFKVKYDEHISWLIKQNVHGSYLRNWEYLLSFVNSKDSSHLISKFVEHNIELDQKRNQNFFETFPELQLLKDLVGPRGVEPRTNGL
jgi:radical SAM protein with 4Fe4S-binding SPASM domain